MLILMRKRFVMPDIMITIPQDYVEKYSSASLSDLINEFRTLDQVLGNQDSETRKLIILQVLEKQLRAEYNRPIRPIARETSQSSDYQQVLLKISYQFCMIFGFFEKAAGSFLFGSNLFALIPGIGNVSLYALTTIYSLLDALLFYAFEVSFLRKAMGIIFSDNGACVLNEIYAQQLTASIEINILLNRRETLDWDQDTYGQYCRALELLNAHLLKKHATMGDYSRPKIRMAVEYGVVLFGGLSSVADSYFMAKTAMLALHISFLSSPLACALVVAMVVSALVFYYAMGARGMSQLVNPDRESYNALKEGLTLFKSEHASTKPYMPKREIYHSTLRVAFDTPQTV